MTLKNFAETLLKGPDFAQNGPLRSNTSQRSQVVVGHGHCVRNRRKSVTVENSPERIPPSPFGEEGREEGALFPGLLEERVIVYLRDFAETLLMPCRTRSALAWRRAA
jgi:hypothetical protein